MRYPWANTALLALVVGQLATGYAGLTSGSASLGWLLWLHGVGAYAIVVLLVWKGAVVLGSLRQRRRGSLARLGLLILAGLLLATLATGLLWSFAGRRLLFQYSLITIHIILAVGVLGLLVWHTYQMRFVFGVRRATGRRAFLQLGGVTIGGLALWLSAGRAVAFFDLPGSSRRFTGSYEAESIGDRFPTVSWLFDSPAPVDPLGWRLAIDGAVARPLALTYEQLEQLAGDNLDSVLDCTGGWYTRQDWQGMSVGRLLDLAGAASGARSVTFEAVSGYARRFSVEESRGFLLATGVAGQPLSHGHGFPTRLVAPGYRGFNWVKWVVRIQVNETSRFWQAPVPLQ